MDYKAIKFFRMNRCFILALTVCLTAMLPMAAQSPEEQEKAMFDAIDKEIEKQTDVLELADWQIFKIDSTLTHDYKAMTGELETLQKSKVSNANAYIAIQDKWMETIYNSYRSVLNDEQWAKYLKQGAGKAKAARDKRAAKAAGTEAKLKEKKK